MATASIPQLPQVLGLTGPEQIEVVQNGVSMRATALQLASFAGAPGGSIYQQVSTTTAGQTVFPLATLSQAFFVIVDGNLFTPDVDYTFTNGIVTLANPTLANQILYIPQFI
jgi:hypothetical protein